MSDLTFTLLTDGSSDRALMPLLTRLLEENCPDIGLDGDWADLRNLQPPPKRLGNRIRAAVELYPCDLLFVHRDSEREPPQVRKDEISTALEELRRQGTIEVPAVCVVPVRMQEAWLLVDERAIRTAAGNPGGRMNLGLPRPNRIEDAPDPKQQLFTALHTASGHTGRKLKKLHLTSLRHRVAELMQDLTTLRTLPAFVSLEEDLAMVLRPLLRAMTR